MIGALRGYQGPVSQDDRGGHGGSFGSFMQPVRSGGEMPVTSGDGSPVMSRFGMQPIAETFPPGMDPGGASSAMGMEAGQTAGDPADTPAVSSAILRLLSQGAQSPEALSFKMPGQAESAARYEGGTGEAFGPPEPGFEPDWNAGQGGAVPNINAPPVIVPVSRETGLRDWGVGEQNLNNSLRSAYGSVNRAKPAPFGRQ